MKLNRSLYMMIFLGAVISSCQSKHECCDEIVYETVHRYGIPLEPQDWSERGQSGQVISIRKDGVGITRCYNEGILHGECSYTFPHRDMIQKKEIYEQGNLSQEYHYYSAGLPQTHTVYESPQRQMKTVWYESGAPHARETIEHGNIMGGEYYNADQQLESKVENGNGLRTCRDGQGQLQSIDTIQNGQMILSTTYHLNGTPATVTPYANGIIEGERLTYSVGGEPATIEKWIGNAQHGTMQIFEHGEKRADVPYINGRIQGIERRYRDDGKTVTQEITWIKGQMHGPTYHYLKNSTQTDWYFHNRRVPNKATFDMLNNRS